MTSIETTHSVAQAVRTAMERMDPEKHKFWIWDPAPFLAGGCDVAARAVTRLLRKRGIQAWTVVGYYQEYHPRTERIYDNDHCWTVTADGLLVDVTLTQFLDSAPSVGVFQSACAKDYREKYRGRQCGLYLGREWVGVCETYRMGVVNRVARTAERIQQMKERTP